MHRTQKNGIVEAVMLLIVLYLPRPYIQQETAASSPMPTLATPSNSKAVGLPKTRINQPPVRIHEDVKEFHKKRAWQLLEKKRIEKTI